MQQTNKTKNYNKQENTEGTETSSIILSNMKVGRGRQCVTKSSLFVLPEKKGWNPQKKWVIWGEPDWTGQKSCCSELPTSQECASLTKLIADNTNNEEEH